MCNVVQGMQSSFDGEMDHVLATTGLTLARDGEEKKKDEEDRGQRGDIGCLCYWEEGSPF
jgi:hypothetical protein